jgi:hypothetical protein
VGNTLSCKQVKGHFKIRLTVLWQPKVQFPELTFVLKSPPIAKLQTVSATHWTPLRKEKQSIQNQNNNL